MGNTTQTFVYPILSTPDQWSMIGGYSRTGYILDFLT